MLWKCPGIVEPSGCRRLTATIGFFSGVTLQRLLHVPVYLTHQEAESPVSQEQQPVLVNPFVPKTKICLVNSSLKYSLCQCWPM